MRARAICPACATPSRCCRISPPPLPDDRAHLRPADARSPPAPDLHELLARAVLPEPASVLREGGVIADGFDADSTNCAH